MISRRKGDIKEKEILSKKWNIYVFKKAVAKREKKEREKGLKATPVTDTKFQKI